MWWRAWRFGGICFSLTAPHPTPPSCITSCDMAEYYMGVQAVDEDLPGLERVSLTWKLCHVRIKALSYFEEHSQENDRLHSCKELLTSKEHLWTSNKKEPCGTSISLSSINATKSSRLKEKLICPPPPPPLSSCELPSSNFQSVCWSFYNVWRGTKMRWVEPIPGLGWYPWPLWHHKGRFQNGVL